MDPTEIDEELEFTIQHPAKKKSPITVLEAIRNLGTEPLYGEANFDDLRTIPWSNQVNAFRFLRRIARIQIIGFTRHILKAGFDVMLAHNASDVAVSWKLAMIVATPIPTKSEIHLGLGSRSCVIEKLLD